MLTDMSAVLSPSMEALRAAAWGRAPAHGTFELPPPAVCRAVVLLTRAHDSDIAPVVRRTRTTVNRWFSGVTEPRDDETRQLYAEAIHVLIDTVLELSEAGRLDLGDRSRRAALAELVGWLSAGEAADEGDEQAVAEEAR
jgi:hypothetical protein